jgi:hypothetical protein
MSLRCESCGRFIGYEESYLTDYEPLSEFGPERISFVHTACEAQGTLPRENAKRSRAKPSGPVPEGDAP